MEEAERLWENCLDHLRRSVPEGPWTSHFQPTRGLTMDEDTLVVAVPSSVVRERVLGRWMPQVIAAMMASGAQHLRVEFQVRTNGSAAHGATTPPAMANGAGVDGAAATTPAVPPPSPGVRSAAISLNSRYTFEAFVPGASNRFAHAAALAVAEAPGQCYNPLFIYGDAGLGKTHLLHAIAHYVQENHPTKSVRYVSCEAFLNDFVDAIRTNTTTSFKRRYRENDILLIDDIQFMEAKVGLQEEFFHTFNDLHGANRQIVISSDGPPRAIATLEDRLRTRFEWGLITDIQLPDFETRLAIARKKADREAVDFPPEVLEFLATHISNNIRELEGSIIRLSAYASLNRVPLTMELARSLLGDVGEARKVTAKLIIETAAEMYELDVEELRGRSRRRPLVNARQVAMFVCRQETDLSYPAIARAFGGRDHTTVIHAVEKIGSLMKERRQIFDQVNELTRRVKQKCPRS